MLTRRGVILGSASLALAGCGGGKGQSHNAKPDAPATSTNAPPPSPPPPPPPAVPLPDPGDTYRNEIVGYGALLPDPAGILDLPQGFSYRVLSRLGDTMDDGFLVPNALDGMGVVDFGSGRLALVRNHELGAGAHHVGPTGGRADLASRIDPARAYDSPGAIAHPGGTTTIIYDHAAKRVLSSHLSLSGTIRNCAGGVTPWGSWLSCEETLHIGDLPHGWVFEVPGDTRGLADPTPLKALGRFNHEAAIVHAASGVVYLTEDREDSLFYRFLPDSRGRLAAGGRLQALKLVEGPADTRNWSQRDFPEGSWRTAAWIDLDGVDSLNDDLRSRGQRLGAAVFARGEGIHIGSGELYFTCTSGGAQRLGQIMRYVPGPNEGQTTEASAPGRLQLFSESDDRRLFNYADNIYVTPWNHLLVCEDKAEPDPINHLKGISPGGLVYAVARNAHPARGELAGACFSPDGSTMFINIYSPGMTLAVEGPWDKLDARPLN